MYWVNGHACHFTMVRLGGNKVVQFKSQSYSELKKHHLEQGTLFIDATFPAIDGVIGTSSIPPNIAWKRPKVSKPYVTYIKFYLFVYYNTR